VSIAAEFPKKLFVTSLHEILNTLPDKNVKDKSAAIPQDDLPACKRIL
jgi:hypothetical protein